jgi:hypothetical protein
MFERRVGNQRDLLAGLGVAKAATQRLALAGGGERTELVAVTVRAGGATASSRMESIACTSSRFVWWVNMLSLFCSLTRRARTKPPNRTTWRRRL